MARNRNCQRIGGYGSAYGTHRFRRTDAISDLQITGCPTRGNFAQSLPHALLKRRAANVKRQVQSERWCFDESHYLGHQLLELRIATDQMRARESDPADRARVRPGRRRSGLRTPRAHSPLPGSNPASTRRLQSESRCSRRPRGTRSVSCPARRSIARKSDRSSYSLRS